MKMGLLFRLKTKIVCIVYGKFDVVMLGREKLERPNCFRQVGNCIDHNLNGNAHLEMIIEQYNKMIHLAWGTTKCLSLKNI